MTPILELRGGTKEYRGVAAVKDKSMIPLELNQVAERHFGLDMATAHSDCGIGHSAQT